jgi:hypothetical protein
VAAWWARADEEPMLAPPDPEEGIELVTHSSYSPDGAGKELLHRHRGSGAG